MNYSTNAIYDYAEGKVNTIARPVYCSSIFEPIPESFPACFIREVSHYQEKRNATIVLDDSQYRSVWNVSVSSNAVNGAMTEADGIMKDAETAFRSMGFIETSKQPEQTADPSIYRIVARFERVIGGSDVMPTT